MAQYTYEQLKDMTVAQLRDVAKGIQNDELEGSMTMHKEQLIPILCKVMNIHIHHAAGGAEKARMKALIKKLKARRDEAAAKKDYALLGSTRRQIHTLTHRLRVMAK